MIRIEHLKKEYANATPLKDVSVEIHDGDVIAVIGPSGTGKSTLLRCINQLEKPTSGRIWVNDIEVTDPKCDINKVRQKMGMVFQSFNLFGHRTVIENIMMAPMDLLGKSKQEAYDTGMRLLRTVGLAEKALNYPDELSGGQKQRIAIARTLAMDPEVILLDEPTSALDPTMVGEVQAVIRMLAGRELAMLIVTHEMNFAREVADRVLFFADGGIYEQGTPSEIFDHPQREKTIDFIRKIKYFTFDINDRNFDLMAMQGGIRAFVEKYGIERRRINPLQLCCEELVYDLMNHCYSPGERPDIHLEVSYAEADRSAVIHIQCGGRAYDPLRESENDLALAIINNAAQSTDYRFEQNHNQLTIVL